MQDKADDVLYDMPAEKEITAQDVEVFLLEREIVQKVLDSVSVTNNYAKYEPGKAQTVNGILEIAIFNIVRYLKG